MNLIKEIINKKYSNTLSVINDHKYLLYEKLLTRKIVD